MWLTNWQQQEGCKYTNLLLGKFDAFCTKIPDFILILGCWRRTLVITTLGLPMCEIHLAGKEKYTPCMYGKYRIALLHIIFIVSSSERGARFLYTHNF